jgi:hypothetical protein
MTLSKELQAQMDRFKKTRSCSLGSELKNELAILLFDIKGTRLNKSCGTCIRNAMQDVLNFISHEVRIETFIGIRHQEANDDKDTVTNTSKEAANLIQTLDKMSYKELKAYAGVKGNIKREKIYEILHLRSK